MSELEQLRKEVNELRERVATLEAKHIQFKQYPQPLPVAPLSPITWPNTVWCGTGQVERSETGLL